MSDMDAITLAIILGGLALVIIYKLLHAWNDLIRRANMTGLEAAALAIIIIGSCALIVIFLQLTGLIEL